MAIATGDLPAGNDVLWLVIVGFAGAGLYELVDGMRILTAHLEIHWAVRWLFLALVAVPCSSVLLAASYFTFRRQYHRLFTLIAVVVAILVFGSIISIPDWLGITGWMNPKTVGILFFAGGDSMDH